MAGGWCRGEDKALIRTRWWTLRRHAERQILLDAFEAGRGDIDETARMLELAPSQLRNHCRLVDRDIPPLPAREGEAPGREHLPTIAYARVLRDKHQKPKRKKRSRA